MVEVRDSDGVGRVDGVDSDPTDRSSPRRRAHRSLWGAHSDELALFAPSVEAHRVRRSSDAVAFASLLVLTWLLCLVADPPSGVEKALVGLIDALPSFLDIVWRLGCGLLVIWVVMLLVATLVRRRFAVVLDIAASLAAGLGVGVLIAHALNGAWPTLSEIVTGGSSGLVPAVGLGAAVAVATAVGPQLSRPFRVAGWGIVVYAGASIALLGATTPTGAAIGLSLGLLSSTLVHLVLGNEAGHASRDEIVAALEDLGVTAARLEPVRRPTEGVYTLEGTDTDGRDLRVRVYGRDARDTQVLAKVWRALLYRDGSAPTLTRLQQVEHEGFVTLLAGSHGVRVPEVLAAGRTGTGDALVVLTDTGTPLDLPAPTVPATADAPDVGASDWASADAAPYDPSTAVEETVAAPVVEPDPAADGQLAAMWDLVRSLHRIGLVLGDVELESFAVDAHGDVQFADLRHAVAAPSEDRRSTDLAQLLVVTAVLHGPARAVVAADAALGADGLGQILPYLQPAALSRGLRRTLKSNAASDVDSLRALAAAAAGVEAPKIARLRRVSSATLLRVGLLSLIAFALITTLGGVSVSDLRAELGGAIWGWAIAAVLVGQLPFLTQAVAARGACPRPVAYGPLAVLQFAIGFINLAIPSSAARIALDVRFFQRQGVPPAAAVSIAAIDGFSGFLVQIALLLATLVFGLGEVDLTFRLPTSSDGSNNLAVVVGVCIGLAVLAVLLAVGVPKIRRRIVDRVTPLLGQVRDTVRSLRSPAKLLQLFGGCLANQVLFALTLGACLHAFGGTLNLATLIVIYVAAALFGGMMPVPGGIGVMEAALIAGLVAAGISETTATATAVTFRMVTFYLPPVWGWFAFNWLQRKSYL